MSKGFPWGKPKGKKTKAARPKSSKKRRSNGKDKKIAKRIWRKLI